MTYDQTSKKATLKYRKKRKQIALEYKMEEYENDILPAIEASGLPIASFIKEAIREKIERERNS